MGNWLLNLPVVWMAVVIFAGTYLLAALIHWIVMSLAVEERARAFKRLSPGMLPPLGIIFGLLVGFIAAQVWSDFERAKVPVATEASSLRTVNLLAAVFQPNRKPGFARSSPSTSTMRSIRNGRRWLNSTRPFRHCRPR
jgi:hypothetical protein